MKQFRYKGYDKQGAAISDSIAAATKAEALATLAQRAIYVSELVEQTAGPFASFRNNQVTLTDKLFLTRELSLLLSAGLKIDRGISLLAETTEKPALKELLSAINADLKTGKKISEAFAKHDKVFDKLYINLLKIAEETGQLPQVFSGLAEDLAYRQALSNKIKQAISYPTVILAVCILSIVFIFNVVVPNLATMFADIEHLPIYTRALLGVSDFMLQYQWWVLGALLLLGYSLKQALAKPQFQRSFSNFLLQIPFVKNAILQTARIRFNDSLSLMLKAGIVIDKALLLAIESISNQNIQQELYIAAEKISHGTRLSNALGSTRIFPAYFASILAVGEEAGELAKVFTEIAHRSRDSFNQWVARMTAVLEPLLILGMGLIVGSVVVIMMLSITATTDIAL